MSEAKKPFWEQGINHITGFKVIAYSSNEKRSKKQRKKESATYRAKKIEQKS